MKNFSLFPTLLMGEGDGTPLQYSCLEYPMDGGAWQAAVPGVARSDMTERLHFHFSLSCIGEGNGNPLQCSCLENSRDGGAWWAAVSGHTELDTTEATQLSLAQLTLLIELNHKGKSKLISTAFKFCFLVLNCG